MKKHFDFKKKMMQNGLKIYIIKTNSELFSLNLCINIGSKYEREHEKGISHFLEHMIFKGTKKRTNIEINEDIESLGGYSNAFTSYSDTEFKFLALNEEFENAIEVLSDMIKNSIFPEKEFKKEKDVIISEIKSDLDNIEDYSYHMIEKNAFKYSFLSRDIAGNIDDILMYKVDDIKEYYNKYYTPNNSFIVIASSLKDEYICEIIEKYFSDWEYKQLEFPKIIAEKNIPKEYKISKPDFEQSNILYLFKYENLSRKEEIALSILNYTIGENSNSYLFKKLREEKGITYEVYSNFDNSEDVKILYIYTTLNKKDIKIAKKIIDETLLEIKERELINENSVKLMKKVFKTSIASTLLDPQHIVDYFTGQIVENRDIYELDENLKILDEIKSSDIANLAKKIFNNPTIQIIEGGNYE